MPDKEVFGRSFNNRDIFRFDSHYLCPACAHAFERQYRSTSFFASRDAYLPFKNDVMWRALLNPPVPPFIICITESYKKHNLIRAAINYNPERYVIRFEEKSVVFERIKAIAMMRCAAKLYFNGFSRVEIQNGCHNYKKIMEFGIEEYQACDKQLQEWRGDDLLEVIILGLSTTKRDVYQAAKKKLIDNGGASNARKSKRSGQTPLFDMETH
ncbi:MAG: hypothetical protein PHT95_03585 [Candidatus Omnitrophica bacterium]|nr:hypothetical protein [Candidatus Omnitrophota bacterium]